MDQNKKDHAVPKEIGSQWLVYNEGKASLPVMLREFGIVDGPFATEAECQYECNRLNQFFKKSTGAQS